ncbi:MAG: IS30 family transposase [Lachnospiraceae bacterium]|nr:IS30 family transposase [Lachnospiraceae bacterium]
MTENNSAAKKHLTLNDRTEIQDCLYKGMTFKAIGKLIGKDQTTVSKEVKKHMQSHITAHCQDKEAVCPKLLRAPFVCNPCQQSRICRLPKRLYAAKRAQAEYEELLVEARSGIPLGKEEFYEVDRIVAKGIKNGQHLYHILQTHQLGIAQSTVYRHLQKGYLSVSAIDFPRVVKFKPRKPKPAAYVPKALKAGRAYEDFLAHIAENGSSSWVEMDTITGRTGGKAILTLDFTFCNFMAGILLDNKTSAEVAEKITALKSALLAQNLRFGDIFPLLLTDNGGEFANVFAIENDADSEKETRLFFCDPYKSCQKPRVEKNHTLFRDIVPKGESFDGFTQQTVNTIFSHINSVKRKIYNGKTPFELFVFTYGEKYAGALGIRKIPAADVIQSPSLLIE